MNTGTKRAAAAIAISLLAIAALAAAIAYIVISGRPDGVSTLDETIPGPDSQTAGSSIGEDFDPEAIAARAASEAPEVPKRPSGWYGTYESSGSAGADPGIAESRKTCPAVYAWIEIPGTAVSYPIAYCEDAADPFYFTHDMNGEPSEDGMIITDSMNADDFSDPLTLIYGQSPDDGGMFAPLHAFKDADFFATHDRINIYMEDAELVYTVYACYTGSAEHILLANDFNDPMGFSAFFDSVSGIRDLSMNIREDARPSFGDHVIALITHCGDESRRFFVYAVLDEVRY